MAYDKDLIRGKVKRWDNYIRHYSLPLWEDIPDIGLYMEQVTMLLNQYLNYLPTEVVKNRDKEKEFFLISPATVNNYVRTRVMPEPVKKRYYRIHIAYLIMICTLKQSLSIANIKKLIPGNASTEEIRILYSEFVDIHMREVKYFSEQLKVISKPLVSEDPEAEIGAKSVETLIIYISLISCFSKILAHKLLMLDGRKLTEGESIDLRFPEEDPPE